MDSKLTPEFLKFLHDRGLSEQLPGVLESLRVAEVEARKPSTRAKQWRARTDEEIALVMEAGRAGAAIFDTHRQRMLSDESAVTEDIDSRLLQMAAELGLGNFETIQDLSARVSGLGYEDRPGTAEYALLSFWQEQLDHAYLPRYEDRSHAVGRHYFGALAIALRSILETALEELQQTAQLCRPKDISRKDLKDQQNHLMNARQAIEKIHGLVVDQGYWEQVDELATIRNRFAHGLGRIAASHGAIGTMRRLPGVELHETVAEERLFEIVVGLDYLEYCRVAIQQLLAALAIELSKWDAPRGVG